MSIDEVNAQAKALLSRAREVERCVPVWGGTMTDAVNDLAKRLGGMVVVGPSALAAIIRRGDEIYAVDQGDDRRPFGALIGHERDGRFVPLPELS